MFGISFSDLVIPGFSLGQLHNMVIHFPIVLVPVSLGILINEAYRKSGLGLQFIKLFHWVTISFMIVAILSGHYTAEVHELFFNNSEWVDEYFELAQYIRLHRLLGFLATGLYAASLATQYISKPSWAKKKLGLSIGLNTIVILIIFFSSHIGANLGI